MSFDETPGVVETRKNLKRAGNNLTKKTSFSTLLFLDDFFPVCVDFFLVPAICPKVYDPGRSKAGSGKVL